MIGSGKNEELVLILAPTGRDAELTFSFLTDAGMTAYICRDMFDLVHRIEHGCGALVLAEEALGTTSVQSLAGILSGQPSWSEIPINVITSGGEITGDTYRKLAAFRTGGNVTVLERPFRPATLVNVLGVAIRSRRRQYQVRDLLHERTAAAERFQFMAESMPQKIFTANSDGEWDYVNQQWTEFSGLSIERLKGWGWTEIVHASDVEESLRQWKCSIRTGDSFQYEHRLRSKEGIYRWHLTRANALLDEAGRLVMWVGSNTDIDDQKRLAEILEKTVNERTASLQETNKQLEAFCYTISHDLRSPLRAQQSFASALLEEYGESLGETGRDYAERIRQAATRLDTLVNDLLAYSRISRTEMRLAPVDLRRAVIELHEEMAFEIHRTNGRVQIGQLFFRVQANHIGLRTAISNLLSNALKFAKPNVQPDIRIWAEERGQWIRLWVEDNGIGINPEYHHQIFGVFHRLHKAGHYPGTGVGLAIVAKAVERMGGRVGVESEEGAGSKFWIELYKAD
jgi:PAS domain S-box-containing protein